MAAQAVPTRAHRSASGQQERTSGQAVSCEEAEMFKVLRYHSAYGAVAIHSVVVEYPNPQDAMRAAEIADALDDTTATPLFDTRTY